MTSFVDLGFFSVPCWKESTLSAGLNSKFFGLKNCPLTQKLAIEVLSSVSSLIINSKSLIVASCESLSGCFLMDWTSISLTEICRPLNSVTECNEYAETNKSFAVARSILISCPVELKTVPKYAIVNISRLIIFCPLMAANGRCMWRGGPGGLENGAKRNVKPDPFVTVHLHKYSKKNKTWKHARSPPWSHAQCCRLGGFSRPLIA